MLLRRLWWALIATLLYLAWPGTGLAREVKDVRLGLHQDHTRLVVDLDGPFSYRLERLGQNRVLVHLMEAQLAGKSLERRGSGRVAGYKATQMPNGVLLEIDLAEPSQINAFVWTEAHRLVVAVGPEPTQTKPDVKPPTAKPRGSEPAKTGPAKPAAPESPHPPPDQTKVTPPLQPKAAEPQDALGYLLGVDVSRPSVKAEPEQASPEVSRKIEPSAEAKTGQPAPEAEKPSPPPSPPIRVKPESAEASGVVVEKAPKKGAPPPKAGPSAAKSAEGQEREGDSADKPSEADTSLANQRLKEGVDLYNQGRYNEALQAFERVESLGPNLPAAEKAVFFIADCLNKLNQETGFPPLDKVEAAYQKALGLYPESAEADRALLRMGQINHRAKFDDKAKGYFNLLLKEHPKSKEAAEAKLELARILLEEGQPQPAVVLLRELTADKPESPLFKHALWSLGRALFDLGRFIEADQRLTTLIQRWPEYYLEEPGILYYLGETAFRLDKMDEARGYLYWYLNLVPEAPGLDLILTRVGETYRAQKDYKNAAAVYTEAVRRFVDSDGALIARIRLAEIKDVDQGATVLADKLLGIEASGGAEQTYRTIIHNHPDRPVADLARLKLGAVKFYQKDYREAFDTFRELLSRNPNSEFSRDAVFALRQSFDQLMKNLADRKEAARLITLYESFAKELPPDWQRRYFPLLAQAYFDLKLYGKALEYFQEVIKTNAKDPQILLGLALSLYNESRFDEAVQAMSRFLTTYPAHRMANHLRLLRGQAWLNDNKLQAAAESFQEVLTKAPDAPEYWPAVELLAQTRIKQGQTKAAVDLLTKTLAQPTPDQTARRRLELTLGEALLELGDPAKAAEVLAKALQEAPLEGELVGLHYRLGQAYLKAGELDKAREVLTKVAKAGDKFWSKLAQDRLVVAELGAKLTNRGEVVSQ